MSWWQKVKRFFGAGPAEPAEAPAPVKKKKKKKKKKRVASVAAPVAAAPNAAAPPAKPPPAPKPQPTVAARAQYADAYEAKDILGLSPEETRRRSLRINPYKTAWIGRVDTIPPQSDERTALIDRGLILRGFLTEEQIREIHKVGDTWLKHHDAHRVAAAKAAKSVEALFEQERQKALALKEQKKNESATRRAERERAIAHRKATDIVFVGRGVSERLHDRRANPEALEAAKLPILATPADLAKALSLTIGELRHLSFHAEAPERPNYTYFEVAKRSGGVRLLSSPHKKLRAAQSFIFEQILGKLELTPSAHGFVPGRSTVSNALPHVGKGVVVNLDLESFFPSVTFPRVRGLFESMGYSPAVATLLALLTTEPPRVKAQLEGKSYWVAAGERGLPQGACTSPLISNLVARKLDKRLVGLAVKLGFAYTRYADDLTFSAPSDKKSQVAYLLARVRHIVASEGFRINEKKGRIQRRRARQEVTGVVVNDKPGVARDEVRKLRAILHQASKTGLAAQNKQGHPRFREHVLGRIGYVQMIDPAKGQKLRAAFDALPNG